MGVYNLTLKSTKPNEDNSGVVPLDKETTEDKVVPQNKASEKIEEKTIVLDGPLSHIYTQALNAVYANEAINMLTQMAVNDEDAYGKKDETNIHGKELYVYCCDGDKLDSEELVNATNKLRIALDKKEYKHVLVSVECMNSNTKIALLDEFSSSLGIKVIYSRNNTIDNIKSAFKG